MKKIIACLLTIVLLFSTGLAAVSAAGTGTLSATNASGYRGDTVTVNVNLNNNPGLISMKFQVSYSDDLTLVSVSNSGLLNGWTTPAPTVSSPYTLRWADSLATTNNTATGTLVTLTFRIKDDADIGAQTVTITFNESRDAEGGKNSFANTSTTITVKCNHSYGTWSKASDTQHSRTCSACQNVEKANHTWNSGSVTKAASCKEEGVKTYTCTGCNATKTESIAKTNDHKYGSWTKVNDTTHKHTCSVCSKEETASHTWNSGTITKQPSCKETGVKTYTCTGCNGTKTETIAKTTDHKYASIWTTDENGHWYTCSGCAEKGSYATHDFENDCDKDCSICGITRETEHKFAEAWTADATNHWHVCSGCGLKQDEAAHEPGAEATATTAQTCTICGYEIAPALGNEETKVPTENDQTTNPTTTPTAPTDKPDPENGNFPWWIIAIVAVVAVGGVMAVIVIKKKK